MDEFYDDAARDAHLAALANEKAGYEARIGKARLDEDALLERKLAKRVDLVDAEIARIEGEEPKPAGRRGRKKEEPEAAAAG